jgi:glycosyltransferase involved in cell wall biosynthesis
MVVRPAEGGIRAHIKNLTENLQGDFAFTVACPPENAELFAGGGCEILPVSLGGGIHPTNDLRTVKRLTAEIKRRRFSLVHAHGFKAGVVARTASRLGGVPCLMTVHGDFAHAAASRFSGLYVLAERILSRWVHGYIVVSEWLAGELCDTYGVPHQRIAVIPNGIDLAAIKEKCAGKSLCASDEQLVGTVARLAPQKGVEYFLRAAALLKDSFPHVRFLVAGDGPLRRELLALRSSLGVEEQVVFLGYCQDVPELLAKLDIFVLPSLSEGQGIAALEAMAAGCPVVASATGGIQDLICHGENGLLAEPGNATALAAAIAELLRRPIRAAELAGRAKDSAAAFDHSVTMEKTREFYNCAMKGRWPK